MYTKHILIVEDERIVALDIKNTLEGLGYSVSGILTRGEEVIEEISRIMPDLVLMDIMLEGQVDGVEAARLVKEKYDIPVIFLSAYSDEITIQRAKISEPYGYVLKPFNGKDLRTIIEMALYKHQMESKLKKMERWQATTLRSIGDAVITTDTGRSVTFMNRAAEALSELTSEEALGKDLFELFRIVKDNSGEPIEDPVKLALVGKSTGNIYRAFLINKTEKAIPINMTVSPIMNDSGIVTGVVFVLRDITQQIHAEDENLRTLGKLRSSMNAIIEAMAYTVETRDPYTAGHQRRVTNLARAIADEMGLDDDKKDGIRMAGVIHDLGKISVPAEILSRPGKLSSVEYQLIQTHPQTGYDILKSIEFPWPVAEIVYQHHEKINGSGYPRSLKGEEILIESKVITVADVVEAMASHRPYRPPRGLDKALEEITQNRGILYDPEVVDACLKLFIEKGFTF